MTKAVLSCTIHIREGGQDISLRVVGSFTCFLDSTMVPVSDTIFKYRVYSDNPLYQLHNAGTFKLHMD